VRELATRPVRGRALASRPSAASGAGPVSASRGVPGVGPVSASRGVPGVGPVSAFRAARGRELAVLVFAQAMAAMADAVVTVSAPAIRGSLHPSGAELELIASGFVLAYAAVLMTGARLGDYGHRRLFVTGLGIFTVAAAASGAAPNAWVLITAQVLQGTGAALMVPQVLSLIQLRFTGLARSRALALYSMVLAAGVAAGQLLGGLLVTANLFGMAWRSMFLIQVPAGIVILVAARLTLPATRAETRRPIDVTGVLLLAAATVATIVSLTFGNSSHWPAWTLIALAGGMIGLGAFALLQRAAAARGGHPLVDTAALAPAGVKSGLAVVFLVMGGYGALLFTLALHLQEGFGYTPFASGLTFATYAVGFAAANLTWSRLAPRLHRLVPVSGLIVLAAAEAVLSVTVRTGWSYPVAGPLLLAAGAGHGAGFGALVPQLTARTRPASIPTISGLITTITQLAIVAGIASLGGLYQTIARLGHPATFGHALSAVTLILAMASAAAALLALPLLASSGDKTR
jgi:MFS family permease